MSKFDAIGLVKSSKYITRREKIDEEPEDNNYVQLLVEFPESALDNVDIVFLARRQGENVCISLKPAWQATVAKTGIQTTLDGAMAEEPQEAAHEAETEQAAAVS